MANYKIESIRITHDSFGRKWIVINDHMSYIMSIWSQEEAIEDYQKNGMHEPLW